MEETITPNENAMNFQNSSFSFVDTMRQPQTFNFMNGMNNQYSGMNQLMKPQKMDAFQRMGGMDYIAPLNMDYSHRIQEMRSKSSNMFAENLMKMEPQNISKAFNYDSDNSDEESKGFLNPKEERFFNPYSSMLKKSDPPAMNQNFGSGFKDYNYDNFRADTFNAPRNFEARPQSNFEKPVYPRMR
jgi:hypothetical protein